MLSLTIPVKMDSNQIAHVLRTDTFSKTYFQGVFPLDHLRDVHPTFPCAIVINTDPSHLPGTHWVAIFISNTRKGDYFDSYGLPPSTWPDIQRFLNKHCINYRYNDNMLQGLFSTVCGQYCIFFLLHKSRGLSMENIISWFSRHTAVNDERVYGFVKKHFPCLDHSVCDATSQCCTKRCR